jgi:hypothetical protein
MTGIIVPMLSYQVHDTEIDVVRHQLDNLAALRCLTGLAVSEEDRYRELCGNERTLLDPYVAPAGGQGHRCRDCDAAAY